MINWSQIVLNICAQNRWRMATLARKINSDAEHIRRLARCQIQEPKYSTGLKLLEMAKKTPVREHRG